MTRETILHPRFQGVCYLTGPFGIGKSTLAAQAEIPDNVLYLDFDNKSENLHEQLQFGEFHDVIAEMIAKKENWAQLDMCLHVQGIIDSVEDGRFTVCIIDNVTPLEQAFEAYAKAHPDELGLNAKNVAAGVYGGSKPGVKVLIMRLISSLKAKGVKTFFAIAHLSAPWVNGVPVPNKFNAKGSAEWDRIATWQLILVPGAEPPNPAAIVMKEAQGTMVYDKEKRKIVPQRILPRRIPVCRIDKIIEYYESPADIAHPRPGEVPSAAEMEMYDRALSNSQLTLVSDAVKAMAAGITTDEDGRVVVPDKKEQQKKTHALSSGGEESNQPWTYSDMYKAASPRGQEVFDKVKAAYQASDKSPAAIAKIRMDFSLG